MTWLTGVVGPWGFVAACGLALVNVILPVLMLRPVAGRHQFNVRALMAVPGRRRHTADVVLDARARAAGGHKCAHIDREALFMTGTVAGLPMVVSAVLVAWSLAHGRFRSLAALAGLTTLASLVIAAVWVWYDMKSMPSIERYGRWGWCLAALPGAYAASVLLSVAWAILAMRRVVTRPAHPVMNS